MKKIFVLSAAFAIALGASAQHRHPSHGERHEKQRPDIAELVSDLSSSQKRKLDDLTSASKEKVDKLRSQQKSVRDSITMYMDQEGDHSKVLYPLFDREAKLQCQISREMYATKVRIDEVLTPEQRNQLKQQGKKRGEKRGEKR